MGDDASVTATFKGSAEAVKAAGAAIGGAPRNGNGHPDAKKELLPGFPEHSRKKITDLDLDALASMRLQIDRVGPRKFGKYDVPTGLLETFPMPSDLLEVQEEIGRTFGGGRYRFRVLDFSGDIVTSGTFECAGPPKLPDMPGEDDDVNRLKRQRDMVDAETQTMKSQAEQRRLRRELEGGGDNASSKDAIEALKREMELKTQLARLEAKMENLTHRGGSDTKDVIAALMSGFSSSLQAQQAQMQAMLSAVSGDMKAMLERLVTQSAGEKEFLKTVLQLQNEKSELYISALRDQKGGLNSPTEMLAMMSQIKEFMGGGEAEESEAVAIARIATDALQQYVSAQGAAGASPGREQLLKVQAEIIQNTTAAVRNAMAEQRASLRLSPKQPGPAPAADASGAPPDPQSQPQPLPQPQPEDPPMNATSTAAVEWERRQRVNKILQKILRELMLMPNVPEWPEYAYDFAPQDILVKFVESATMEEGRKALMDVCDPALLVELQKQADSSPEKKSWLEDGLADLKEIYRSEKAKRPMTAPAATATGGA